MIYHIINKIDNIVSLYYLIILLIMYNIIYLYIFITIKICIVEYDITNT